MSGQRSIEAIDWQGNDGISLRLENGRASGSGGINRLMGDYQLTDNQLSFGAIATTMMAGPPERMESERRFLAALDNVARWSTTDDVCFSLVLADEGGAELLRLTAQITA